MGDIRATYQRKLAQAKQELDLYNKRWWPGSASASWFREGEAELRDKVAQFEAAVTRYTKTMGEGKIADGEWVGDEGARGIQARLRLQP